MLEFIVGQYTRKANKIIIILFFFFFFIDKDEVFIEETISYTIKENTTTTNHNPVCITLKITQDFPLWK